ncbi:MAG: glutamate--tRNA ligase [Deltaproteobacteria bacterium]|jgi:glutamyl-tRNA synthetase|nr:glutamate--tRNA ligase [Deltaproteobacteria bacterium]
MKTRFAPSPTGHLHVGGARTALFNWLAARHAGGEFVLRIEDTDLQRSKPEYTRDILSSLSWLGLDSDGEPVYQTQRAEIYSEYAGRLLASGDAYWCHCPQERIDEARRLALENKDKPRYDGRCRDLGLGPAPGAVLRFKCPPDGLTGWNDIVKGPVSFDNGELDDLVIVRSDGFPTYNMAVVADDVSMGITHVLRGDDHVNNTPRQLLLYRALKAPEPEFGHLPMIMGGDRKRLSKRHGATSVLAFREMGYLPQALVNYLARLGWSSGDREIFTLAEMTSLFSLSSIGKSAAVFNGDKLDWLNAHYIKETPEEGLAELMRPFLAGLGLTGLDEGKLQAAAGTVRERGKTLRELAEKAAFYFRGKVELDPKAADKLLTEEGRDILRGYLPALERLPESAEDFDALLDSISRRRGIKKGAAAQPLRLALTGSTASPGLYEVLVILGTETARRRIEAALEFRA